MRPAMLSARRAESAATRVESAAIFNQLVFGDGVFSDLRTEGRRRRRAGRLRAAAGLTSCAVVRSFSIVGARRRCLARGRSRRAQAGGEGMIDEARSGAKRPMDKLEGAPSGQRR